MADKQMKPRRVVVMDVDGVFSDFYLPATQMLKDWYGKPEEPVFGKDAKYWGFEAFGITVAQENEFWKQLSNIKNFWATLPEMERGIVKHVWNTIGEIDSVVTYFCTARQATEGMTVEDQTDTWFKMNGWKGNTHTTVSKDKGYICKGLKADFFIDDKASNVISVMKESPKTQSFFLLLDYQKHEVPSVLKAASENNANLTIIENIERFLLAVKHAD